MVNWITDPNVWAALLTLTALEIVLGIDNIIFIAILAGKLPDKQQARGRRVGLLLAMVTRIALLFSITLIMKLTRPLFTILTYTISGRDIILIAGGLFLLGKSTLEIHGNLEGTESHTPGNKVHKTVTFGGVVAQIMLLDIVFSIDSVITAIGLAKQLGVMVAAIVIAVVVMIFSGRQNQRLCRGAPDDQNTGAELSFANRRFTGGRRSGPAHPKGLHLFCHGLLDICGTHEFAHSQTPVGAGSTAKATIGKNQTAIKFRDAMV